jgi:hypothetical protein
MRDSTTYTHINTWGKSGGDPVIIRSVQDILYIQVLLSMCLGSNPCVNKQNTESLARVESSLMLRSTVSRPVCLGVKHPSEAYDQILFLSGSYGVADVGCSL